MIRIRRILAAPGTLAGALLAFTAATLAAADFPCPLRAAPGDAGTGRPVPGASVRPDPVAGCGGKEITIMTTEAGPVPGDAPVTTLVMRARDGDQQAWDAIVERYAPLVWSICRRYQLDDADAGDAGQTVWLHLVDQLDKIRDPAALPGWLATTTRRECGSQVLDAEDIPDEQAVLADDQLLRAERHAALREAVAALPPPCQDLIALLIEDPPLPHAQISARFGIPVGSIGPTRSRRLAKLRRHPAIATLANAEPASVEK
jgi:RNA polymerase sigma factor (sigma-70 family)